MGQKQGFGGKIWHRGSTAGSPEPSRFPLFPCKTQNQRYKEFRMIIIIKKNLFFFFFLILLTLFFFFKSRGFFKRNATSAVFLQGQINKLQ